MLRRLVPALQSRPALASLQQVRFHGHSHNGAPCDHSHEPTPEESRLTALLQTKFGQALVSDVSGGCGSFYEIRVVSPLFKGKSLVQQHRMVTEFLKTDIAKVHGVTLKTEAAE